MSQATQADKKFKRPLAPPRTARRRPGHAAQDGLWQSLKDSPER